MTQSIVVLDAIPPARAERFRRLLPEGFSLRTGERRDEAHLCEIIAEADYAVSGQVGVPRAVLQAGRRLRLVHKWGVGVDTIDLDAARELGIRVARTTGANAVPVAEFTIGLILAALRCIAHGHAGLSAGTWRSEGIPGETYMLSGKTVGIVGLGAVGQALARLLRGFGCTILYAKRTRLAAAEEEALGVRHAGLAEILAQADVVTLNCPLTPETAGLIDRAALAAMKPTAVLVNVARGGVVVEEDLVAALRSGVIRAAALDVYDVEPLPAGSPLRGLDNLVITPHLAALATDNFDRTVLQMIGNITRIARGEPLPVSDAVV